MNLSQSADCSLVAWVGRWIDSYAPLRSHSLKTIERYRALTRYFGTTGELKEIARTPLSQVNHNGLETAILSLVEAPATRRDHLSPRTIVHFAGLVRAALGKAYRLDLIPENPMLKVELPSVPCHEARSLTAPEVHALLETCLGDWTFTLVELALGTGCRRGELLALEWADLDLLTERLTVSKSLEQTAAGLRLKSTKSGRIRRLRVPLSVLDALREHRSKSPESRLIFVGRDGNYIRPDLLSQTIVRRLRKAGIGNASLHTLRHTHASTLLSRGVPLAAVSARLGHADADITARIYCHALPADDGRAAEKWDEMLAEVA